MSTFAFADILLQSMTMSRTHTDACGRDSIAGLTSACPAVLSGMSTCGCMDLKARRHALQTKPDTPVLLEMLQVPRRSIAGMFIKKACQGGIWTQLRAMGQLSWRKPPISGVTGLTSLLEEATEG